jgi:ComF family protein
VGQRRAARDQLTYVVDALVAAILAPRCAACSSTLEYPTRGPVCDTCWADVKSLIPPVCDSSELGAVDRSRSAGRYDGALRHIIHAFKYEGRRSLSVRLGTVLAETGADVLSDAHCVVPVPLHPWRRLTRGFNQASDLASCLELPIVHALWRTRATAPQTGLTAARRRRNVRGAFMLSPLLSTWVRQSMLEGHIVVLIDDVRTTGATLDACAQVLKKAGVKEVRALTLALAE